MGLLKVSLGSIKPVESINSWLFAEPCIHLTSTSSWFRSNEAILPRSIAPRFQTDCFASVKINKVTNMFSTLNLLTSISTICFRACMSELTIPYKLTWWQIRHITMLLNCVSAGQIKWWLRFGFMYSNSIELRINEDVVGLNSKQPRAFWTSLCMLERTRTEE